MDVSQFGLFDLTGRARRADSTPGTARRIANDNAYTAAPSLPGAPAARGLSAPCRSLLRLVLGGTPQTGPA